MARDEHKYLNRELSWLEFNHRVLEEAQDRKVPLLERLKFLAITDSNLNEFFMVRLGGLRLLCAEGITRRDPSGRTPPEQVEAISKRIHTMVQDQYRIFTREIEPGLAAEGVCRFTPDTINDEQRTYLSRLFDQEISAVLSPMAVSLTQRFPVLVNLGLHLLVRLAPAARGAKPRFAVLPMGTALDRFVVLPSRAGHHYILLEDVARPFIARLFPGENVVECRAFRITRNADMSVEEDGADLLAGMKEILSARKTSECVRLEIQQGASHTTLDFIMNALAVERTEMHHMPGPLNLASFMKLSGISGFDHLRYEEWEPQPSPAIDARKSMFDILAQHDLLLIHPYQSYDPVLRLIDEAADDPDVLAIKQVLYRTSSDSPIIRALRRAAQRGKYVTVLVELKARFDEARNIAWAEHLEQDGVQVVYGVKGLKTHAKACVIVRREPRGIVRYLHFGTGNYNEKTARLYTDISYMTCNEALGADASAFFNALTGTSAPQRFLKLELAPLGLRERLIELIDSEAERKRQGQDALIMAKMNSLVDTDIIDALYRASAVGVPILLNVRGTCCLRPGVPDLSENIRVVSIIDRFLEHSRVFYFEHGGEKKVLISSADWMPRNLDRRAELLIPVDDHPCRDALIEMLEVTFRDTAKARLQLPDGGYRRFRARGHKSLRSQKELYRMAREQMTQVRQERKTVFEPHRPSGTES